MIAAKAAFIEDKKQPPIPLARVPAVAFEH
jgi:hypothetical protein